MQGRPERRQLRAAIACVGVVVVGSTLSYYALTHGTEYIALALMQLIFFIAILRGI